MSNPTVATSIGELLLLAVRPSPVYRRRRGSGAVFPINGRLREEFLNETLFTSLAQARLALGCWRADYNDMRPHSQLGWRTPSEFAMTCHPRRDLVLRYAEGSAPAPVAPTAQQGKSNGKGEIRIG
jgi:putative transposase